MALPTTQQQEDIASIYAAIWNRAPDPVGFGYWVDLYANGMPLDDIADAFRDSPEGIAAYPLYQTGEEFVTQVYLNVFNREPDDAGLAYWTNLLSTGAYTEGDFITVMVNSAVTQAAEGNEDGLLFINKVEVGQWVAMDYLSGNATQEQIDVVTSNAFRYVTASESSVTTAETYISHLPVGTPYELTVNQDAFNGVAGNDLFIANLAAVNGTTYNTLTPGDRLNGGDGWDTLDVTFVTTPSSQFTLQNVEQVNIESVWAGGDASLTLNQSLAGVEFIQFEDNVGVTVAVTATAATVDVEVYNSSNVNLSVTAADTAAAQTLYVDTVAGATVTLSDDAAGSTPVLNIVSQGGGASDLAVAGTILQATTLNVYANAALDINGLVMNTVANLNFYGDQAIDLSAADLATNTTGLITVDASDALATVSVDINNLGGASLSATFGIGNDTLDIIANAGTTTATVAVDMGLGNDVIEVAYTLPGNTNVGLNGGLGDDILVVSGVTNTTSLNDLDFTYGSIQNIETLEFAAGAITLSGANAYVTLSDGFSTVDLTADTVAFGTVGYLSLSNLDDNSTIAFSTVVQDVAANTANQFDFVVDAGGALALTFDATANFTAGTSVANDWTFTNATDITFDLTSATTDTDLTVDFNNAAAGGSVASLFADNVESISFTGGSVASFVSFDISALVTTTSDLTALNTVDFSGFAGTISLNLDANSVIENGLTIVLNDGYAAATDGVTVATITGTDLADIYEFGSELDGMVYITNFANLHGAANSDLIDLSAFGVTSFSELTLTSLGSNAWTIESSSYFDGVIKVQAVDGSGLLASDFIFA